METRELVSRLHTLVKLDIDAVRAYEQAMEKIEVVSIRNQLEQFKADHERHITELSEAIQRFGGEAPKMSPDLKGFLIEGFTALRSVTGTEGALKAMQMNEKLTNKTYEDAISWNVPADIRTVLVRGLDDERRHLEYIQHAIESRIWESVDRKTA
ncbi:MAG: DUF2383 domain-containing protein [Bdellovibrionota bacterium]